jgi:hypothetical protein
MKQKHPEHPDFEDNDVFVGGCGTASIDEGNHAVGDGGGIGSVNGSGGVGGGGACEGERGREREGEGDADCDVGKLGHDDDVLYAANYASPDATATSTNPRTSTSKTKHVPFKPKIEHRRESSVTAAASPVSLLTRTVAAASTMAAEGQNLSHEREGNVYTHDAPDIKEAAAMLLTAASVTHGSSASNITDHHNINPANSSNNSSSNITTTGSVSNGGSVDGGGSRNDANVEAMEATEVSDALLFCSVVSTFWVVVA